MPDRISSYRQVRLILEVPQSASPLAHWSLIAVRTTRGIPDNRLVASGYHPFSGPAPSEQQIWAALAALVEAEGTH